MTATSVLKQKLSEGAYDEKLRMLYAGQELTGRRARLVDLIERYEARFGETDAVLFSAPGRTELGGNHTDHQHGCVLAASVNLDTVACAAPNGTNVIRILSAGYPEEQISLDSLEPRQEEINRSAAIIRGTAAAFVQRGYAVGGFDACVVSDVLGGSGLSSSAAYETLIGVIVNHFFCGDALDAMEIAKIGQYAENAYFGKPSGLLDQASSSVGGVVAMDFMDLRDPAVEAIDFSFTDCGHALCIIDSGADHADLTDDYAAVPREMKSVAAFFGKDVLREVPEEQFAASIAGLRAACGDRAVLRAAHFYAENERAQREADALREGDFARFCALVKQSGQSSFMYLQNIYSSRMPDHQAVSIALMTAERLLGGRGAFRVHGGGFAGTIQAFVPNDLLEEFKTGIEAALGAGCCHVLSIRPVGGIVLT
ncbi:MAG TPA: galactokinase [Candidatus Butyricicoccus stercorigallinarum]|nr:galactokinase [Candidatus Butyricicoccus stercorigallinarum]